MHKVVRFPSKLNIFFSSLTSEFHWNHFEYFRTLVFLIVFSYERRNISALYRQLDRKNQHHRSRFNNFVNLSRWNPEEALEKKAYELLKLFKPEKGETVELIIDDSKKKKTGKKMEAVAWVHDPVIGKKIRGHQYVEALIHFRGYAIPFGIRLYVKKEACKDVGVEFEKTTGFAAGLIKRFNPPEGVKVSVLFDSYYLCPVVVKACRKKGFHFVSVLKNNRNLFKNGRKLKVKAYSRRLFRDKKKRTFYISKTKVWAHYRYVDAGWMDVSKIGNSHVIFSRKKDDGKIIGLVTNDPKFSAEKMIQIYDKRWNIEVFFKDAKQLLGLGQYQNGSYRAAVTHLHLVCFAYALLTHIAIKREGAKGKRKSAHHLSTGELQNELRRIVWDDLVDYLNQLPDGNSVVKELRRLLMAS